MGRGKGKQRKWHTLLSITISNCEARVLVAVRCIGAGVMLVTARPACCTWEIGLYIFHQCISSQ